MFTRKEIDEIAQALEARGKKDSQFPMTGTLDGAEEVAIIQNNTNMRTTFNSVVNLFSNKIINPFIAALEASEKLILDAIAASEADINNGIGQSEKTVVSNVTAARDNILKAISDAQQAIIAKFGNTSFEQIENEIIDALNNNTQSVLNDISSLYTQLKGDLVNLDQSLSSDIGRMSTSLLSTMNSIEIVLNSFIKNMDSIIAQYMDKEFDVLTKQLLQDIEDTLNNSSGNMGQLIIDSKDEIMAQMNTEFADTNTSIQTAYNNILTRLNTVETNIRGDVSDLSGEFKDMETSIGQTVTDIQNSIARILEAYNEDITDEILQMTSDILARIEVINSYWKEYESRQVTLTVSTQVTGATITLNNIVTDTITVVNGYAVNVRVTADGYHPFNQIVNVFRDQTVDVVLDPIVVSTNHIVKVITDPVDATVTINNVEGNEQTVTTGTRVTIVVSKDHYTPQTIEAVINEDRIFSVTLVPDDMTFRILPTPNDSTVIINGVVRTEAELPYNSVVTWEVSRTGYTTQSGTLTLTGDTELPVNLVKQQITVNFQAVPDTATIKINGVEQTSITVDYGTIINYEVSADGYVTATGSIVVDRPETITIVLEKTYVSITEGHMLYSADGGTQKANITSNTGWIFK